MAAIIPNFDLILQGVLRQARNKPDALGYLNALHGEALDAVMAQDTHVNSTTFKGQASAIERELPANVLLALYEAAIQVLEAEARTATGLGVSSGSVRHADFSLHPCTLG